MDYPQTDSRAFVSLTCLKLYIFSYVDELHSRTNERKSDKIWVTVKEGEIGTQLGSDGWLILRTAVTLRPGPGPPEPALLVFGQSRNLHSALCLGYYCLNIKSLRSNLLSELDCLKWHCFQCRLRPLKSLLLTSTYRCTSWWMIVIWKSALTILILTAYIFARIDNCPSLRRRMAWESISLSISMKVMWQGWGSSA